MHVLIFFEKTFLIIELFLLDHQQR